MGSLLGLLLLLSACGTTTVFLANFNSDKVGSPPAFNQTTGTVSRDEGTGTVRVVAAPEPGLPANKWVRIQHLTAPSPQTAMKGEFSRFDGLGNYSLLTSLYIPSGTGIVTLQFETFGKAVTNYLNFLHLDFMPEGDVRIDDGPLRFGHFPRDQVFVLSVNLVISNSQAEAHIALLGGVASGNADVVIRPILLSVAHQFGAVRFWMGFQTTGSFFVDDIIVTRKN